MVFDIPVVSRMSAEPAVNPLVCACLRCLCCCRDSRHLGENRSNGSFAEKGARFRGKWGLGAPPPPPPPPHPRPPFSWGGFTENLRGGGSSRRGGEGGGGAQGVHGEFGRGVGGRGRPAPFTVKMSPLFGENAFQIVV